MLHDPKSRGRRKQEAKQKEHKTEFRGVYVQKYHQVKKKLKEIGTGEYGDNPDYRVKSGALYVGTQNGTDFTTRLTAVSELPRNIKRKMFWDKEEEYSLDKFPTEEGYRIALNDFEESSSESG